MFEVLVLVAVVVVLAQFNKRVSQLERSPVHNSQILRGRRLEIDSAIPKRKPHKLNLIHIHFVLLVPFCG